MMGEYPGKSRWHLSLKVSFVILTTGTYVKYLRHLDFQTADKMAFPSGIKTLVYIR